MFEKEITLPRCGGKVWLRRRLSDGRADGVDNAFLYRLPTEAMGALMDAFAAGGLSASADPTRLMSHLAKQGFDAKGLLQAQKLADRDVVRLVVKRWANVFGAEGEPLEWDAPDSVEALDEDDFRLLVQACYDAVREGRADPNAGRASSGSPSSPDAASDGSPSSSETPSASTSAAA